jgi:hypothetical protein
MPDSNARKLSRSTLALAAGCERLGWENDAITPSRADTVAKRVGSLSCRDGTRTR